ncbi:MAG: hypothetical protein Q8L57_00185 [bacterium]|nr:hypothetical protein [bacterium]
MFTSVSARPTTADANKELSQDLNKNGMLKKIVIVSSVIFACIAIIAGVYFLFFQKREAAPGPTPTPLILDIPSLQDRDIIFVSQNPYLGATLNNEGKKIRYFDQSSRSFMESEFSGLNPVRLSAADFKDARNFIWSPDKSKVLTTDQEKYQLIDLNSGQTSFYDPHYRSVVFSPNSDKIAFNFLEPGSNKIETAELSGQNWKEISRVKIQDLKIAWPQNGKLALSSFASAKANSGLFLLDIAGGDIIKIIPEVYGLETLWSPKGDKVLYSFVDKKGLGPILEAVNFNGVPLKELFIATFASKCAWSLDNRTIYCGVPNYLSLKMTFPDDYYRGYTDTNDQVVKINLDTGEQTTVFAAETNPPDVENLLVDPREEHLFFTNKKDGLFYAVKL